MKNAVSSTIALGVVGAALLIARTGFTGNIVFIFVAMMCVGLGALAIYAVAF